MHLPENAIPRIKTYLLALQNTICHALEQYDASTTFQEDKWERAEGGGGISRVLEGGSVFSKAGVNFSHVYGDKLPVAATDLRQNIANTPFEALGVSLVIHPRNPYVPTTHCNVRFFSASHPSHDPIWWFGGGFDLTPYYGFHEDCTYWHHTAKAACDPFGTDLYPRFKKWADDYFYLPHRNEARGIGGIFFDDFTGQNFEDAFGFMQSVGDHFMRAYGPLVTKRKDMPYTTREHDFQQYRRGRYVEFNLLYDRGTRFGLQSGGRTESILMSLPDNVTWRYHWHPEKNTPEASLYEVFLPAQDWLAGA